MAIQLPELPYAKDALSPVISANTLEFHYGKHHRAYVDNANKLIAGTPFEKESLDAIIQKTAGDAASVGIFNNTAQIWNHSFYWQCLKPGGGGSPTTDPAPGACASTVPFISAFAGIADAMVAASAISITAPLARAIFA